MLAYGAVPAHSTLHALLARSALHEYSTLQALLPHSSLPVHCALRVNWGYGLSSG